MSFTLRRQLARLFLLVLLAVLFVGSAMAQISTLKSLASAPKTGPAGGDPLGRVSPRASLLGFIQAAQSGNTDLAAQYLEIPPQGRGIDSDQIVKDLKLLLDQAWDGTILQVSDLPDPTYNSQLRPNEESAGSFTVSGKELDLIMVRVTDATGAHLWLVAWKTLSHISDFANDTRATLRLQRHLPAVLWRHHLFELPIWVWMLFVVMIPFALFAGWLAVVVVRTPAWILRKVRHQEAPSEAWKSLRAPVVMFATAFAHAFGMTQVRTPLLFRVYYGRVLQAVLIYAVAWLFWDFVSYWTKRTRARATGVEGRARVSLILLGHRLLKAGIIVVALLTVLANMGVNLTAALAGLGIGGIAVALAAQKTIENLFGGVSLLSDRVIRVGDYCRIGDKSGTVEDIGLRSTRLRTDGRAEVSIPNGLMASASVENFSVRDKFLLNPRLNLRLETSPEQLRAVLDGIHGMLLAHHAVEKNSARVRLEGISDSAFNLVVWAYVLTREYESYLALQEDLLSRMIAIIAASGAALAVPAREIYMAQDGAQAPQVRAQQLGANLGK